MFTHVNGSHVTHVTFLHSEPIVPKLLTKCDNDYRDSFGFIVGEKYTNESVQDKFNNHTFVYQGGWLGGKL